jgi:glycosyltransferase involved in cell wall biosynthesis
MSKSLCISIPTFNRSTYLKTALDSIVTASAGYEQKIEVKIYDNASTDSTESVGRVFAERYDWISYNRNPKNIGATLNIQRGLRDNDAEYVLVLGDDDLLVPSAIGRILAAQAAGYGLIVLNFSKHTADLSGIISKAVHVLPHDIEFTTQDGLSVCGATIGFISSNVVRRELAVRIPPQIQEQENDKAGCGYALCLYAALAHAGKGLLIAEPLIRQRCGNGYIPANEWVKYALSYCDELARILPEYGYDPRQTAKLFSRRKSREFILRIFSDKYRRKPIQLLLDSSQSYFRDAPLVFGFGRWVAAITPGWLVRTAWQITHGSGRL